MFFKGFPSMPKGDIVGMFSDKGRVCVFIIDGKDHHDQQSDDSMVMARSTMKRNGGHWISFRIPDDHQI
jgi:hypothetical protein